MDNYINIQGFKIFIDSREQISKNGRPFRLSGISLLDDEIWINRERKRSTVYWFRYLDKDEFFGFEFAQDGKFRKKIS